MTLYIKSLDVLNKIIAVIASLLLAVTSLIIIFQVASRYIFHYPLPWSEELSRYLIIYVVIFGTAIAVRHQKLIAVDFISELLSFNNRKILTIIIGVISILFFLLLLIVGFDIVGQVSTQRSPSLQVPMSVPYASIPLGAILMILNSVGVILETIKRREE